VDIENEFGEEGGVTMEYLKYIFEMVGVFITWEICYALHQAIFKRKK